MPGSDGVPFELQLSPGAFFFDVTDRIERSNGPLRGAHACGDAGSPISAPICLRS